MTIVDFLLARIAEDEERARARSVIPADLGFHSGACELLCVADYLDPECTCNMGERMLAECEAKRRIVELHTADHECSTEGDGYAGVFAADGTMPVICPTMLALALPYADRPGYREEWRP